VIAPPTVAAALASLALVAGAPLKVTLKAPGHSPKVNKRWYYTVHATRAGKPVVARLTAQIVDPIGGVHPVEFGRSTKKIVRWRFRGTFRDFIIWPRSSRGIPLKLRLRVVAGSSRRVIVYRVVPRA
jgi:hypothetical protein